MPEVKTLSKKKKKKKIDLLSFTSKNILGLKYKRQL